METVLVEKKNINEVVELLKQDEVVRNFSTETVFLALGEVWKSFGMKKSMNNIVIVKQHSSMDL